MSLTFQHEGHYVCECGREFTKAQSFNAHLGHCKIHLGEERYLKQHINRQVYGFKKAEEALSKKKLIIKFKNYLNLIIFSTKGEQEDHYCEFCGNQLPKDIRLVYGTGRFCNESCARTYSLKNSSLGRCGGFDNIYFKSSYELIYYIGNKFNNKKIKQYKGYFIYFDHTINKNRKYFPDFYHPDTNTVVECKGSGFWYNKDICNEKGKSVLASGYNYLFLLDSDIDTYGNDIVTKYIKNKNLQKYTDLCNLLIREDKNESLMFKDIKDL